MYTDSSKLSLSAASFLACSLGWLLTYLGWVLYISVTSIHPGGQDLIVIGSWSALFGVLIWLCLYLPYALWFARGPSWLYHFPGSIFVGMLLGLLGYYSFFSLLFCPFVSVKHCLDGLLTHDIWWFPLFAGVVGAVAGLLFPFLLAALQRQGDRVIRSVILVLAFVGVPGMLWITNIILWPAFMERYPAIAYEYVDMAQQRQMYVQLLSTTQVGDTLDSLRKQLPHEFPPHFREDRGFLGRQFYAIAVKEGIVTSIHVDPLPEPGPAPAHITYLFPEDFTGWANICYAVPGADPLPMEKRRMTIEFPASGLVVTSTPPTPGRTPMQIFRLGPDGPHKLRWVPKDAEVGIGAQYFGTPMSYTKNRTATLRLVERIFVGNYAQTKNTSHSMTNPDLCPPAIVRTF